MHDHFYERGKNTTLKIHNNLPSLIIASGIDIDNFGH